MKKIQFVRDTDQEREGGEGWKTGDVVELVDRSAERWIARSAARVYVESEPEPAVVPAPPPATSTQPTVTPDDSPPPAPAPTPTAPAPVHQQYQPARKTSYNRR